MQLPRGYHRRTVFAEDLAGGLYDKTLSFLIIVVLRSGSNLQPHVSEEPLMCHPRARQPPDHGAARVGSGAVRGG